MTTVYHLPNSKPGGWDTDDCGRMTRPQVYHTDRNCRYISGDDRIRESTKEQAERRGLDPCSACAQDREIDTTMDTRTCPVCGEETDRQLASHIRHDCTGK